MNKLLKIGHNVSALDRTGKKDALKMQKELDDVAKQAHTKLAENGIKILKERTNPPQKKKASGILI